MLHYVHQLCVSAVCETKGVQILWARQLNNELKPQLPKAKESRRLNLESVMTLCNGSDVFHVTQL